MVIPVQVIRFFLILALVIRKFPYDKVEGTSIIPSLNDIKKDN